MTDTQFEEIHEIASKLKTKSNGKIILIDYNSIAKITVSPEIKKILVIPIKRAKDLMKIRNKVKEILTGTLDQSEINKIVLCVSELLTNVLKYADNGILKLYIFPGKRVLISIADSGEGMNANTLEKVFFEKGYSTKNSLGYGMKIVLKYSDKVYINTGDSGTFIILEYLMQDSTNWAIK